MDQLGKESFSHPWGAIATAHLLDGLPDPRKTADSQAHGGIDKHLTQKLKIYGLKDAPPSDEKTILSQVGPSGAYITCRAERGGCRLGGARCKGWMDLGE